MRTFDVQGIEIMTPRHKLFEFLREPRIFRNGRTPSYPRETVGPGSRRRQDPWMLV